MILSSKKKKNLRSLRVLNQYKHKFYISLAIFKSFP